MPFDLKKKSTFSIFPAREDIIREHKMGCLRVSAMIVVDNLLWIGESKY